MINSVQRTYSDIQATSIKSDEDTKYPTQRDSGFFGLSIDSGYSGELGPYKHKVQGSRVKAVELTKQSDVVRRGDSTGPRSSPHQANSQLVNLSQFLPTDNNCHTNPKDKILYASKEGETCKDHELQPRDEFGDENSKMKSRSKPKSLGTHTVAIKVPANLPDDLEYTESLIEPILQSLQKTVVERLILNFRSIQSEGAYCYASGSNSSSSLSFP